MSDNYLQNDGPLGAIPHGWRSENDVLLSGCRGGRERLGAAGVNLKGESILRPWPLLLLACALCLRAVADPLVLPAASTLDTNALSTNGLVMPSHVQFLLRDLQSNVVQLTPLLAIANGSTNPANAPSTPRSADTNINSALIYSLGAVLENLHSDIQELLPHLAAMVGQTNYPGNPVATNIPTISPHSESTNSNQARPPETRRTRDTSP